MGRRDYVDLRDYVESKGLCGILGIVWYLRDYVESKGLCGILGTVWYLRDCVVSQ